MVAEVAPPRHHSLRVALTADQDKTAAALAALVTRAGLIHQPLVKELTALPTLAEALAETVGQVTATHLQVVHATLATAAAPASSL